MNLKVIIFILGLICCLISFFAKNPKRVLLFLLSLYFIFTLGWVFYHYTGVWLVDFPLIILISLGIFSGKKFRFYFPKISLPIIGIIIWASISALCALNVGWAIAGVTKIVRAYLVFLCIANFVKTEKDLKAVIYALFAGLFFESLLAIYQWRFGYTGLWFLGEYYHRWRATGTFYVPHFLGNYLIILLPILFRLFIFYKPQNKRLTGLYGTLLVLGTVALFVTFARGPWIAFIASMALMILLSLPKSKFRPKVKGAVAALVVSTSVFLFRYTPTILSQFGEQRKGATTIRFDQFRIALRVIKGNPILGTGLANYELISPQYVYAYEKSDPRSWQFSEMVHNSYLFFTAETGLPGGILFLWCIILIFKKGFRVARSKNPYFSNLGIGILTGFLAILIAFLAGPDIHNEQLLVQFWLLAGLLVALNNLDQRLRRQKLMKMGLQNYKASQWIKAEP